MRTIAEGRTQQWSVPLTRGTAAAAAPAAPRVAVRSLRSLAIEDELPHVKFLTAEQHRKVLGELVSLGRTLSQGDRSFELTEYNSLMVCFLLQNMAAAESLNRLALSHGSEWFPATVGYTIARSMFEVDVAAHFIAKAPAERARRYIDFGAVLTKWEMDAYRAHCESMNPQWREAMNLVWQNHWAPREAEVEAKYDAVRASFSRLNAKGKTVEFNTWSGKSIRDMAIEVDHHEAYEIFYAELSSFTHVDIRMANRFLQMRPSGPVWSQRTDEYDYGNVFRHAATFLTCNLEFFGSQFQTWTAKDVERCWAI